MPGDERGRGSERCSVHGSSPSVATCDGCGRAMCLNCATPVRGRTLGAECLAAALGPEAPVPEIAAPEPGAAPRSVARVALGVAIVGTVLPWSRFGAGSEPFGAWSTSPNWSMVAALASVLGLLALLVREYAPRRGPAWDLASTVAGSLVALGSLLAIARPPAFTSPWLGPWVALFAGVLAVAASIAALRGRARRHEPAHV